MEKYKIQNGSPKISHACVPLTRGGGGGWLSEQTEASEILYSLPEKKDIQKFFRKVLSDILLDS